jgi:tripartite-type tricarboxylate transporter receptor subunit TctC
MRRKLICLFALTVALFGFASTAAAADWPTRPVKFLVTLGAGSGADIGARLFADRLSKRWGEPVIVENRPGGDALVAINTFVTAHDDHVLLFAPSSSFTAHPYLHDKLPYRPGDLVPIARVSNTFVTIAVPVGMKADTLGELVALIRKEPGRLNWAGVTGTLDFMFAGWLKSEDLDLIKVPYRNPVDAAKDLAESRVQVYEASLAIVRPELDAGKIKILAMTNTTRSPAQPDIPTVREAGFPALTLDGLVGLFGPPGMPLKLRKRIASDFAAVADDTIKNRLEITGQLLNIGGPEQFATSIDAQRATLAVFAKALGVKQLQ